MHLYFVAALVLAAPKKKAVEKEAPLPPPQVSSQGSLSPDDIRATISKDGAKVGKCYQDELTKNKDLRGRVHVTFVVEIDGSVAAVKVRKNSLKNTAVEQCVVDYVKALAFPKPQGDGMVIVNYPFNFNPAGAPPLEPETADPLDPKTVDIVGDLDGAAVNDAPEKNKMALDKCFADERKRSPKLNDASLTAMYIVDKDGKVERSFLKDSSVNSPRFEACVLDHIKTWTLVKPTWGRAYVTQPISFKK